MLARLLLLIACACAGPMAQAGTCRDDVIEIRQNGVKAQFSIDLAITPQEQAKGLMFVDSMPQFKGMLFINERPRRVSFWMKNTLIPLDMLFMDATGRVQTLKNYATPLDTTPIPGGENIQYILEINGGLAGLLGLSEGAEARYIGFDQENAVWPCE